ncbi:MAG TPA: hypothetical protein PLU87_16040 [Sedimentisphaerales bacterium]|nr:hypothetical protein [Sedimentisphaerales bacterium]HRS12179.1 hypothetical protein [Sedimentisphaerales bacterium]HRV48112.1 hypothetical protein [Sedimentisphaerales bacterium]
MDERTISRPGRSEPLGRLMKWAAPCLLMWVVFCPGCSEPQAGGSGDSLPRDAQPRVEAEPKPAPVAEPPPQGPPSGFGPAAIIILPLTELSQPTGDQGQQLHVYVSLADAYGSQMKAPGVFRLELYDYVQRSAEPKGPRIAIWPDIDLTNPAENQKSWRDFLRAYEFTVPVHVSPEKTYVLEVTCLIPTGRRLSAEWLLRPGD